MVVDAEGRVAAAWPSGGELVRLDAGEATSVRLELPGGAALVLRRHDGAVGWYRFARAFVHEVRSPLNALAIYLELAATRVKPGATPGPTPTPIDELLEKASHQVRRVDDFLKAFGVLWSPEDLSTDPPQGDTAEADLAHMVRVAVLFGEKAAMRLSVHIESEICESATVKARASDLADALVVLLVEAMEGAEGRDEGQGAVRLRLQSSAAGVRLEVRAMTASGTAVPTLVKGERALVAVGASVDRLSDGVVGVFR